ncbi:hypothetical protein D3C79_716510 [compost metagenome]
MDVPLLCQGQPGLGQGLAHPGLTLAGIEVGGIRPYQCDAAMAPAQQIAHCRRRRPLIVDTHVGHGHGGIELTAGDPGQRVDLLAQPQLDGVGIQADGAIRPVGAQQLEGRALPPRIGAGVAQQHEVAMLAGHPVDAAHHLDVEGVGEVGHHDEQQPALGGAQAGGQVIDPVAEFVDGAIHLGPGLGGDPLLLVEHPGDGSYRHPGLSRHGGHGDGIDGGGGSAHSCDLWVKCNRLHF